MDVDVHVLQTAARPHSVMVPQPLLNEGLMMRTWKQKRRMKRLGPVLIQRRDCRRTGNSVAMVEGKRSLAVYRQGWPWMHCM